MRILEHINLSDYTSFHIGGPARYFVVATSAGEAVEAINFAKEKSLPVFVLGGGSNVLVSDGGFDGVVIKNEITGIERISESGAGDLANDHVILKVGAGEDWDGFVSHAVGHGWGGIENLALIPGSVGASPVQNIGAYGAEVKDVIISVEAIDLKTAEAKIFSNKDCEFAYRDSVFKRNGGVKGGCVITHVTLKLSKRPVPNISYKDLKEFFAGRDVSSQNVSGRNQPPVTIKDVMEAVRAIRKKKLPSLSEYGTAGSFFKNPIISTAEYETLKKKYPGLPFFPHTGSGIATPAAAGAPSSVKIPLAWILDHVCGFKGVNRGRVGTYKNQALVIINNGGASADEVRALAENMARAVKEHTGITIEPEVQYVGF